MKPVRTVSSIASQNATRNENSVIPNSSSPNESNLEKMNKAGHSDASVPAQQVSNLASNEIGSQPPVIVPDPDLAEKQNPLLSTSQSQELFFGLLDQISANLTPENRAILNKNIKPVLDSLTSPKSDSIPPASTVLPAAGNLEKGVAKVASWLEITKHNRVLNEGVAKLKKDEKGVTKLGVTLDDEDLFEEEEERRCLVGLFPGTFPGKEAISKMVNQWKHFCRFHFHNSGWIVFEFEDEQTALDILASAPYYAGNKPLTLKQMPKLFNFSLEACTNAPVWIQLPNLPLRCWKPKSLNKICTFIGTPVSTDQITNKKTTKSFARCLVDVDFSKHLPTSMKVTSLGITFDQHILYENKPEYCDKCKRVGHMEEKCRSIDADGCPPLYVPAPKVNNEFTTFTNKNARRRNNRRIAKASKVNEKEANEKVWKPVPNEKTNTEETTCAKSNILSKEDVLNSASFLYGPNRFSFLPDGNLNSLEENDDPEAKKEAWIAFENLYHAAKANFEGTTSVNARGEQPLQTTS